MVNHTGESRGEVPTVGQHHFWLMRSAAKAGLTRSEARQRPLPGRVVDLRRFRRRAVRPCLRISAATVFWLTAQPSSRSSAVILDAPYLLSGPRNSRLISAFSLSRRAARGANVPVFHL